MAFEKYLKKKQAFIFELDDVIYPLKDYLLQVYYLFAQFMEYGEQMNAAEMVKFMQETYYNEGPEVVLNKTAQHFKIPEKYGLNFVLLMNSVRLPLKLLIFNEILKIMQEIVVERKQIFLFTNGEPDMQINKIKQIEWHGLEKYLKAYFAVETSLKPSARGIQAIINEHKLKKADVLLIGRSKTDETCALNAGVDYLPVTKLLSASGRN